jgi:DNA-binding transcriptional regulator GbsR (MarR family)
MQLLTYFLESVPFEEAEAMTIEEIKKDTKLGKTKIGNFLRELMALSLVVQTGGGVKGDPLRYFRPNDSFLPIKGGSPERMNPDDDELFG